MEMGDEFVVYFGGDDDYVFVDEGWLFLFFFVFFLEFEWYVKK